MKIDLKEYMNERDALRESNKEPGPVITISREYGCGGSQLARNFIEKVLSKATNLSSRLNSWSIVNKEILKLSADDLKTFPKKVEKSMETVEVSPVEDLFSSLSSHYELTDKRIHETVAHVISDFAKKGHTIIVGRGGSSVIKNIERSLRIKLIAPLEWRIKSVAQKKNISEEAAQQRIEEMDPKRAQWNVQLSHGKHNNDFFDIIFNRMLMSESEIISVMTNLCAKRGII